MFLFLVWAAQVHAPAQCEHSHASSYSRFILQHLFSAKHQVRLSIFPASTTTTANCARHDGTGNANDSSGNNNNANTGDDSKGRRRSVSLSSPRELRLAGPGPGSNLRRPRGSGNTDGYVSDSSKQSTETDEAVVALRRAGGYDLPEGLQGGGLLLVRYDLCGPTSAASRNLWYGRACSTIFLGQFDRTNINEATVQNRFQCREPSEIVFSPTPSYHFRCVVHQ